MSIGHHILRGVVCGLLAGLLAGFVALVVVEPTIDRAVALEAQRSIAATGSMPMDIFSRPIQHLGLLVAMGLIGTALGGLFGIVFFAVSGGRTDASPWERALRVGGAFFVGFFLVPFVRYPANPPGVGLPSTISQRSAAHFLATLLGLGAIWACWRMARWLQQRGVSQPIRQTAAALVFLTLIGGGYALLPNANDPVRVPASLLWNFRLFSLATQALLWGGLAAGFGFWTEWKVWRSAPHAVTAQDRRGGSYVFSDQHRAGR
ncbi:MAG TPA: CbtA family protein [Chloroflexota bacterium]|nr:CbtA family protein [Chloroflexota bacterium]